MVLCLIFQISVLRGKSKKVRDFLGGPVLVRVHTSTAEDEDLIPGRGTKIPRAAQGCKKKKKTAVNLSEVNGEIPGVGFGGDAVAVIPRAPATTEKNR